MGMCRMQTALKNYKVTDNSRDTKLYWHLNRVTPFCFSLPTAEGSVSEGLGIFICTGTLKCHETWLGICAV